MINVREVMNAKEINNHEVSFVLPQKASVEDAQARLNVLTRVRDELFVEINDTNTGCTPGAWRDAYSDLTIAIARCVKAEKDIINEA